MYIHVCLKLIFDFLFLFFFKLSSQRLVAYIRFVAVTGVFAELVIRSTGEGFIVNPV